MKLVWLNDWATLRKDSVAVHWMTVFSLSFGRIDIGDIRIRFGLQILGLGFQIQSKVN